MNRQLIASSAFVGFRTFDSADAELLTRTANDVEIQRLAHPFADLPRGEMEYSRRIAEGYLAPMSGVRQALEVALVRRDDDSLVAFGVGGLYRIDERNANVEIGVSISSRGDRGLGLGKDAHLLMISYAFEVLGMHRVYGHAKTSNRTACGLAESIGMIHEGTMREHRRTGDEYTGLELFGVLRAGWPHRLASLSD
jgi:RimJ/RimL family protein N-acetyltransferase